MTGQDTLSLVYNHIVLPPRLPGEQDSNVEDVERDLLTRVRNAVQTLKGCPDNNALDVWDSIEETLKIHKTVNQDRFVNQKVLKSTLESDKIPDAIVLHVTQQNAGLLIRTQRDEIIFEAFEASPSAEQTLAAKGAMQWDFPTVAVALPLVEFQNPVFQENLVAFLERASLESVDEFAAKTRKAGVTITEARNTTNPALVTQFLMTLLEINGNRTHPPILRKNVKDDVCWEDAELPWRRSPLWLILRVSVQRLLYMALGEELGRPQYKFLMAVVLSQLLTQCVHAGFNIELCSFLRSKLCRRLAKLERERETANAPTRRTYLRLFEYVSPICRKAIQSATSLIGTQWDAFKSKTLRRIPTLPRQAYNSDLFLTLPFSGTYLRRVLAHNRPQAAFTAPLSVDPATLNSNSAKSTTQFYNSLLSRYELQDFETDIELTAAVVPKSHSQSSKKCHDAAEKIHKYIEAVGDAYDGNSEQMSIFILSILTLWMCMDQCASNVHPLLRQYHPFFHPEMLDVLLLSHLDDLKRLRVIQSYISNRCIEAKNRLNIFADPQEGCFADQFFVRGEQQNVESLKQLQNRIETANQAARMAKERDLQKINASYNKHLEGMMESVCTQRKMPDGTHDIRGCTHCWHVRSRRRLKIQVHEDFLPGESNKTHEVQQRAILFELDTPSVFSTYRSATWEIICRLRPSMQSDQGKAPEMLLSNYAQLAKFSNQSGSCDFSLASTTKSFLGTHYNFRHLPATATKVLLPLALKFAYYDTGRGTWAHDTQRPLLLAHHVVLKLPKELSFSNLYASSSFAAHSNGPTSYDTVASISECPSDLTIHEYAAHQNLIAGRNRRWFTILTELGSSNVNFSLQDTMILFHHISLQAGPRLENDDLRAVHVTLKDLAFCEKLLHQIEQHVNAISQNWRENYYMETLLTLTVRVCTLGHKATESKALALLLKIRNITLTWTKFLREETRTTQELDVAERSARYGFLAALLCRRTFFLVACHGATLDTESLKAFVEATLAMQENFVVDINRFSNATMNILIRDIKMTHRMRSKVRHSVIWYQSCLGSAIDAVWPSSSIEARLYSPWKFLNAPYDWWVTSTVSATAIENTKPQMVHYHLLEGHLLIDNRALGKLPSDIRGSQILKELFGNQRLVAFPSDLHGMSYMLGIPQRGYNVHIGYREQDLVIQARKGKEHLELIPSHVFGDGTSFDIPASLIHDCVHWLDLHSGLLEARRKPNIWKSTPGNWNLNLHKSEARRKDSILVNPASKTFRLISQIFRELVPAHLLTVYQPLKGHLSLEIKSMDLSFVVNKKRLLQCRQLGSEIDPNQDAGTLYGLQSMIVLRDARNPSQRSVLTTLGHLRYQRSGVHVEVLLENTGPYAHYSIDCILGRLHCPPEPRLLYNKAQLHALTSFVVPDPLTGRTGTEEALRCLQSASSQPWNPLQPHLVTMLQTISSLTPRRHYYPDGIKQQQKVSWNCDLTTTIQHEAYQHVIDSIMKKSQRLRLFKSDARGPPEEIAEETTRSFLYERALWRRSIFERPENLKLKEGSNLISPPSNFTYIGQGRWTQSGKMSNTREILTLLWQHPQSMRTTRQLRDIMREWPIIGGYDNKFVPCSINECLEADLAHEWGGLVNICRKTSQDAYDPMFLLGLLAFSEKADMRILRTMAAFFLLDELKTLKLPCCSSLSGLDMDQLPSSEELINILRPFCQEYQKPPLSRKKKNQTEILRQRQEEAQQLHEDKCREECTSFAVFLIDQWPIRMPSAESFDEDLLDKYEAIEAIAPYWQKHYDAFDFGQHISEVQAILDRHYAHRNVIEFPINQTEARIHGIVRRYSTIIPRLSQVLICEGQPDWNESDAVTKESGEVLQNIKQNSAKTNATKSMNRKQGSTPEIRELENLIARFSRSDNHVRSSYGHDLARSIDAFKNLNQPVALKAQVDYDLDGQLNCATDLVKLHYRRLKSTFSTQDARYDWLNQASLWPCMSPISLLEQLRSCANHNMRENVKYEIVKYATALSKLQYLLRMKDAVIKNDEKRLAREQANPGHTNWDPSAYPDWLLLEIDANIYIRGDQVTVALEMIHPTSESNSVLQMNMGQGKTSVIMPMVACILANGKMLTRLLVPNALLSQTAQILQSRLGGLIGRELTHIPFSRRSPTTEQHVQEYRRLHEETLDSSGIILAIPEHVLSFKLCGLQRISDRKISEAKQMVGIQGWMDQVSRDILDECDFTLATKTQLVYPSGTLLNVDGHPCRWKISEFILDLVAHHLRDLARDFPRSIDVIQREISAFPVAHFLRSDVEQALKEKIIDDIFASHTSILPIRDFTIEGQEAIRKFVSQEELDHRTVEVVTKILSEVPATRKNVYLLRGLLVHGILLLCLKKRWNVQYGLHPKRDPVAVPFHAKGVPSEQAEWGHPDVAILFTCLAFYYHGLDQKQIRQSLQVVLKSDDPATEYDRWIQASASLPEALRHWNIINIDDDGQIAEIWRHLRSALVVVNHFLNHFVFPAHAKQFSIKLQASGWDVPLFNPDTKVLRKGKKHQGLTTGFSGTNDNRRLLPLTVEQQDLPGLLHTNAEVLTYLLQKRNREYILAVNSDGRRFSEFELLDHLKERKIRTLIDAGAFILEMDNKTLVKEWLQRDYEMQAAVYFADDNKASVYYRNGRTLSLLATPFADNLENCLVYLDEAHTRGTDLPLPAYAKGALTLGLNQTKDHTVQAAMRMRQLGTTQSIAYVAPPEVHQSIQDVCMKSRNEKFDSSHIVTWLLHQTCNSIEELQPLYFSQGKDFCHRVQAASTYGNFLTHSSDREAFMAVLEQPEQQTLEQIYAPRTSHPDDADSYMVPISLSGKLATFDRELKQRQSDSRIFNGSLKSTAFEQVEQEREVAYQVEEEREVQRPQRLEALSFPGLHTTIRDFLNTGYLSGTDGYTKASEVLERTKIVREYGVQPSLLLRHLYVSTEFLRTIKTKDKTMHDNYIRPVNWILWGIKSETALVIIPEEAELVIPLLRGTNETCVHLLLYAAPVTRKMLHFDDLTYYDLPMLPPGWKSPNWLSFELGILAGSLYFNFVKYDRILQNLHSIEQSETTSQSRSLAGGQSSMKNMLAFLHEWLALRRSGQDITHTPMGYVCQGRQLRADHPFFMQKSDVPNPNGFIVEHRQHLEDSDQEYYSDSDDGVEVVMEDVSEDGEHVLEDVADESVSIDLSSGEIPNDK